MLKKLTLCWGLLLCTILSFGQKFPEKSKTLVTDYTSTLSADQQQQLEQKLFTHNDTSAIKIAVVIMKSVGEYDIAEYAALLGRNWGIGNKENNAGVLVLVAIDDRKMTIQTGYGAEGTLPDAITQSIIQNDMKPRFKAGDYYGGLDAAVDDIVKYTKGEYKAEASKRPKSSRGNGGGGGAIGFIVIIIIVILISIFKKRGGGGGGQIIGSRGGASPFWWFLAGSALGSSGRSGGSDWGGFSGGGGSSGGGGWGGGSSGSFGGGSFGGGGSSGSW